MNFSLKFAKLIKTAIDIRNNSYSHATERFEKTDKQAAIEAIEVMGDIDKDMTSFIELILLDSRLDSKMYDLAKERIRRGVFS